MLATKPVLHTGKGIDIKPSVEVDVAQIYPSEVRALTKREQETESGKGKTTSLVDKQVEVDVRATPGRPSSGWQG